MSESKADKANQAKGNLSYILAVAFLILGIILPWVMDINPQQSRIVSILFFAIVLWSTEAMNPIVVSISVLVLISLLKVLPYSDVAAGLGSTIIWRLIGIFIFAEAVKKSGLAQRIVYRIFRFANGKVRNFYILFLMLTYMFVFLVPAITGRVLLMLTMVLGLFSGLKISPPSNIGKIIFISLPMITLISSTTIIVGSSTTIYAVGLIQEVAKYKLSYLNWFIANFPIGLIITVVIYFILTRLYPPEIEEFPGGTVYLNKAIQESGPFKLEEKKVIFVYGLLLFFWFSNLSTDYPAELLAALILLFPKIGILTWKEAVKAVEWGVLILFSAGFAIAKALEETKIMNELIGFILSYTGNFSPMVLLTVVFLLTMTIRQGMNHNMPVIATLIPIVITLGTSVGINPVWLSLVTLYASTCTFLPTQTSPGVITYSYGFFSAKEMAKAAVLVNVVLYILVFLAAKFYWPLVGITIIQ